MTSSRRKFLRTVAGLLMAGGGVLGFPVRTAVAQDVRGTVVRRFRHAGYLVELVRQPGVEHVTMYMDGLSVDPMAFVFNGEKYTSCLLCSSPDTTRPELLAREVARCQRQGLFNVIPDEKQAVAESLRCELLS
jgi:hypothetical protein